jgi:hypothetical protein
MGENAEKNINIENGNNDNGNNENFDYEGGQSYDNIRSTYFEKILGNNNSTYVRDGDKDYDNTVNNDNENNNIQIQPDNLDTNIRSPRVNNNDNKDIKNNVRNNKNNYHSDYNYMPYNNKNCPESTINAINEGKMHPYTKKNEVLEQKLINNLNFKSQFNNNIYVPPSLYNKNEYDILLGT